MKKFIFALFATLALVTTPAMAETATAVVNVAKIMRDSKAAVSVRSQLQAKQKSFQAELDTKEKALLAEDQALVKQKDSADKAGFEKKVKDFREKAAGEQRAVQTKKAALDKAFAAALESIQKNVLDVVKQVATEKKLNLVLSSTQVLYSDAALDITDEVLKRLDGKLPSVAVKF
jgi:Skp family chaperone for outer membrane proteins